MKMKNCEIESPDNSVGMGVSEWKQHGLKFGYWNFFETEIRKDWQTEEVASSRLQILDSLKEKIENMQPEPPYPNASNGYQSELDKEEKIENEVLLKVLDLLDKLK